MKVTASNLSQQVNWQAVANKKQQDLKEAAKGETLQRAREEQQLELYQAKGKRLELQSISSPERLNVKV